MSKRLTPRFSDESGVSMVETIVALMILLTTVTTLVAGTGLANRSFATSRRDLQWWSALQWKADSLMGLDSTAVFDSSDVVNGYPVSWSVFPGSIPRRVEVVVGGGQSIVNGRAVADTVVVYLR